MKQGLAKPWVVCPGRVAAAEGFGSDEASLGFCVLYCKGRGSVGSRAGGVLRGECVLRWLNLGTTILRLGLPCAGSYAQNQTRLLDTL